MKPLVSIGLPTYNRAGSLRRAVESALRQDYPNLELVISDNASTDATEAFCRETAARDPRVRYIRQPENVGPGRNFRSVLREARGELYMWLADDDWIDPAYVSECARVLGENPDHQLACGQGHYYEGGEFAFAEPPVNVLEPTAPARVLSYFRQVGTNGAFYGVMRRETLLRLRMDDGLASDWLMVAGVAFHGKLRTLEGVHVHRSLGGVSGSAESLARSVGLTGFFARNIHVPIAWTVFQDIARRSELYAPLGRARRFVLAFRSAASVLHRFYTARWWGNNVTRWNELRARLILRTRLKRLLGGGAKRSM